MHQRLVGAQQVGVAHGAAHDPAQHVAAAFVRGRDAVGDQEDDERRWSAMTRCDGAVRSPSAFTPVSSTRGGDQRAEQVDVVVVVHALQHGGDALQAHAGVDRGLGQRASRRRRRTARTA